MQQGQILSKNSSDLSNNGDKSIQRHAIILGSSRSNGNTRAAVTSVIEGKSIPIFDLKKMKIGQYDYKYRNQDDDFIDLMEKIVNFDVITLATPVYWYSMSAMMKIFIDRLSDLLDVRKDLGRSLKGKKLFVIASFDTSLPCGFEDCFEQTCKYLNIGYLGTSFIYSGTTKVEHIENNAFEIQKAMGVFAL